MKKTILIGVRISDELHQALSQAAEHEERSISELIRIICRIWLRNNGFLKNDRHINYSMDEYTFQSYINNLLHLNPLPPYLDSKETLRVVHILNSFFNNYKLSQISPRMINEYEKERRDTGINENQIKEEVNILKTILTRATRN